MDFAWFLSVWLLHFHGEEKVFWRTMNPVRCAVLYRALLGSGKKHDVQKPAPKKGGSLSDYMRGGA